MIYDWEGDALHRQNIIAWTTYVELARAFSDPEVSKPEFLKSTDCRITQRSTHRDANSIFAFVTTAKGESSVHTFSYGHSMH